LFATSSWRLYNVQLIKSNYWYIEQDFDFNNLFSPLSVTEVDNWNNISLSFLYPLYTSSRSANTQSHCLFLENKVHHYKYLSYNRQIFNDRCCLVAIIQRDKKWYTWLHRKTTSESPGRISIYTMLQFGSEHPARELGYPL
jgi:hypothetical protein